MQAAADFWVYLDIIRRRLWLTLLLLLVTVGIILTVSLTAKPAYRASVRLQVLATDSSDISLFSTYRSSSTADEILQAQNDFIRALQSGFVAWQTIADLNLDIGSLDLIDSLSFSVEGDFVMVTVQSDDPGRAEAIANTQVDNALEYYRGVRATPSKVLREFVTELLSAEEENVHEAEQAVLDFKGKHNLDSIEQETLALQNLIRSLRVERDRVLMERDRAGIFAESYRAEQAKALAKITEIQAEIDLQAEETASEEAPIEPATGGSPATLKYYEDLARQHEATAINWEATRDGHARSIEIYDEAIERDRSDLGSLLSLSIEFSALDSDLSRAVNNYNFLWDKENEARLKQLQAERLGYIQITEPARKPDAPVASKTLQLVLVGAVVSVLTGFLLSFVIEFFKSLAQAAKKQRVQ